MASKTELAAARLRAEAEKDMSEETVVAAPAAPPQADLTDGELKARVQARFDKVIEKMGPQEQPAPGYGTMMTGIGTGAPGDLGNDKGPSKATELKDTAHSHIGSDGGAIPQGPAFSPPQVINTPGGMIPNAEKLGREYDAAPAFAQEEFRQMGKDVNQARFGAEADAAEATKAHATEVADAQKQVQEYQQEQHRQQLAVMQRQEALTARHEELMGNIEREMSAIPDAPRTIREKLDRSGIGDRLAFGFAAAFSVLGSGRNGGASAERFINTVRTDINSLVMKEKDEYEKLGEKAKRQDNLYLAAYKALGDKTAALEVTRKLYTEAADAALKEQAARYQGALVGPNLQKAMAEWEQGRAEANLKAAGIVKQVAEKTMRYVPPTSKVVYDPRDPRAFMAGLKQADYEKLPAYRKYLDDQGYTQVQGAVKALERAVRIMPDGFNLGLFINGKMPTGMLNTALSALDGKQQQAAKQELQHASNLLSREANGQSKTANEIILSGIETGLHNKQGAIQTLKNLQVRAQTTKRDADTTYRLSNGAPVGMLYDALEQQGR